MALIERIEARAIGPEVPRYRPLEAWEYGVLTPIRADAEGMTHLPDGAGLGIELDPEAIEAATIGSFDTTATRA